MMARTLKRFDFPRSGSRGRYPWDKWCDGQIWKAMRGVDFDVEPAIFQITVKNHAKRHGMTVQTAVQGEALVFQFSPRP